MGFRSGSYATVWEVVPKSDVHTVVRLSISRKNRETGAYINDFSSFVSFFGSATAAKAAKLKEKDRIKLGDVDVSTSYDKETKQQFTNFKCFNFEIEDRNKESGNEPDTKEVDDGEVDKSDLPF